MNLQKQLRVLAFAHFLVVAVPVFAVQDIEDRRFVAKELRVNGNRMIPTAELLEKLPRVYREYEIDPNTGKYSKDPTTGEPILKNTYDFRVLHEIIADPGRRREISLKTIQGLTSYILSVYREKGYAGIYVYVPAKAVVEGRTDLVDEILIIEVLEGTVATITVERYDFARRKQTKGFLKESLLKSWSPIKEGQVIQRRKLDYFVRLLNLNPDRQISAVISRSAEPNALDLSYDVYEGNPWHWYLQLNNAGTRDREWAPRAGVINTNLTGRDDRFSLVYQAPWDKDIDDEFAVIGNYDFPVFTPRLRLNLYAAYSRFDIPAEGVGFLGNGSLYGSVLSYNVFQRDGWFVDVTGSVSRENSKVTPSLGSASDIDINLWGMGLNIHRSDDLSDTSIMLNRGQSIGGSSQDEFEQARMYTDRNFAIYSFHAARGQYLDKDKVYRLSGFCQWTESTERLVPAKMSTFGGLYSVRGYKEDEIVADGGVTLSGQCEFDLVKHGGFLGNRKTKPKETQDKGFWLKKLAPLVFVDAGRAKIKDPVPGERGMTELCSMGVGTIVELGNQFRADMYYGHPLRGTDDTDSGEGRWNFNFVYRF